MNDIELEAVQLASLKLKMTSPSALLIEKRSIERLLDKTSDTDPKKKILKWLIYLLRKYRKIIGQYQDDNKHMECDEIQANEFGTPEPPEEFKCPISMQVMHDPTIIASGMTFERFWIQKWFIEGNQTCPITLMKLDHLFMTPNSTLKELISDWSSKHGFTIPDPYLEPNTASIVSRDSSFSSSVASFRSSVNNLSLHFSAVSIPSSGTSDVSGILDDFSEGSSSYKHRQKITAPQEPKHSTESYKNMSASLSQLAALSWGSQCKTVRDVNKNLRENNYECHDTISNSCVKPLIKFLKDALELNDVKEQRDGAEVLLAILRNNR